VTSAPTRGPRSPDFISPSRLAATPAAVAVPPWPADGDPVAPASAAPGFARPPADTRGISKSASLGGSRRATAAPAPSVNRHSKPSVSAIIRASRFTVRSPSPDAGPSTGAVTEGIHHNRGTHQGSEPIIPPGREIRLWSST
jgi:hypothetical protein